MQVENYSLKYSQLYTLHRYTSNQPFVFVLFSFIILLINLLFTSLLII